MQAIADLRAQQNRMISDKTRNAKQLAEEQARQRAAAAGRPEPGGRPGGRVPGVSGEKSEWDQKAQTAKIARAKLEAKSYKLVRPLGR